MSACKKGPIFDPGMCRCCGNMKKCRLLNIEYESHGEKEVYSDMIMDCFGLLLSNLDSKPTERLVCATCVTRLRDALNFKKQVLLCEDAFMQMKLYDENAERRGPQDMSLIQPFLEVELLKTETRDPTPPRDALADHSLVDTRAVDIKAEPPLSPARPPSSLAGSIEDDEPLAARAQRKRSAAPAPPAASTNPATDTHDEPTPSKQPKLPELPMSKIQQLMRERDPSYMTETNILSIVEYSFVCPFKCRHNHLICYYCGDTFTEPLELREHTVKLHHPKKFKIIEHKKMVKLDLTRIDCRLCLAKIDDLEEFKRHITNAHNKKYYFDYPDLVLPFRLTTKDDLKCAMCDQNFPYFHALNKHMNTHFNNYMCETCGLGFVDKGRFMMHQMRHEEGDFPCETCGKVFKAQYNRDLHIDRVHKKRGRVFCPKCDVMLMSYPQKLKHLVEVHGEQPLSFPCNMCDKVCDTRRTLTIHKRKDHLKDYRYECQYCGQKFFTRFALNNHMPTHTLERNYKCKVCEKTYPRLKTLRDHMRIHNNDRRYRCHVCGQAFIQNCSLKGHMKSQHPEYG